MGSMILDENRLPFSALDAYNVVISRPPAFTGGTANTRGDEGGTNDPYTLFTVTGDVLVRMWGVCTVDLAGATATISVGVTGNTAALLAVETATEIDANGIYVSATQVLGTVALSSVTGPFVIANGLDIIETLATADITSGNIYYICLWRPVSRGKASDGTDIAGSVVAAGTQI